VTEKKIRTNCDTTVTLTDRYSVCCHALELSNFMTILNSKAQIDPILAEHIATM
jgi:hypothetical protein